MIHTIYELLLRAFGAPQSKDPEDWLNNAEMEDLYDELDID